MGITHNCYLSILNIPGGDKAWRFANSHQLDGGMRVVDGLTTTSFTTGEANYPWMQLDMRRTYLITKVAILSAEEPLMNLEIRFGDDNMNSGEFSGQQGKKRIEGNTRCGIFYGPTLVVQQWVEVDCGFTKGVKGRFLSLQLTERYGGSYPLEITSLEIYGGGRACGNKDPDQP